MTERPVERDDSWSGYQVALALVVAAAVVEAGRIFDRLVPPGVLVEEVPDRVRALLVAALTRSALAYRARAANLASVQVAGYLGGLRGELLTPWLPPAPSAERARVAEAAEREVTRAVDLAVGADLARAVRVAEAASAEADLAAVQERRAREQADALAAAEAEVARLDAVADAADEMEAAEVARLLDEAERERAERQRALVEALADAQRAEALAQAEQERRDAAEAARVDADDARRQARLDEADRRRDAAADEAERLAVERAAEAERRQAAALAEADRLDAEADAADRAQQRDLDAAFYAERRAAREQRRVEAEQARREARRERREAQRRAAEALARTEAAQAAAQALAEAPAADAVAMEVVGWIRILDADPCARCVAWWNSGGVPRGPAPVRPYTVKMKRHRGCQCVQRPVTREEAEPRGYEPRPERAPRGTPHVVTEQPVVDPLGDRPGNPDPGPVDRLDAA